MKCPFKRTSFFSYEPPKNLAMAYLMQAVYDYFYPTKNLTAAERDSAKELLHSEDGKIMLEAVGISPDRIEFTLMGNP